MSCPSKTAITDSELNDRYMTNTKPGLLPSTAPGVSDRDGNGILNKTAIQTIIGSLKNSGVLPVPNSQNTDLYMKKVDELLKDAQSEYCFYESRYKYALERLLNAINQGYINNSGDVQNTIQKYLGYTQILNQQLNDLTQIINGITEDMLLSTSGLEQQVKEFDKKMRDQQTKLQAQNKTISSNQAVMELNKQMVKFTEQKAKYSNNLLGLYSFLNIVALGLLIYVYKSARD